MLPETSHWTLVTGNPKNRSDTSWLEYENSLGCQISV